MIPSAPIEGRSDATVYQRGLVIDSQLGMEGWPVATSISKGIGD